MTLPPFFIAGTTPVYQLGDGSFVFLAGMDIDGDGSGGNLENDPDFQPTTSLRNSDGSSLNSRVERFFVLPGALIRAIKGACLGCQGYVGSINGIQTTAAVVGDIGPDDKAGEGSIALASYFGVNANPLTGGIQEPRFIYRFWPDKAATTYRLQPL